MFPKSIKSNMETGIAGELAFDSPLRAKPVYLKSADEKKNLFGRALTFVTGATATTLAGDEGKNPAPAVVAVGGTGRFAGILANPKVHANYAFISNGTDAEAGLFAPNGSIAEAVTMGELYVPLEGTGKAGEAVAFDADGKLYAVADVEAVPVGQTLIDGAEIRLFDINTATGGAVVAFTR